VREERSIPGEAGFWTSSCQIVPPRRAAADCDDESMADQPLGRQDDPRAKAERAIRNLTAPEVGQVASEHLDYMYRERPGDADAWARDFANGVNPNSESAGELEQCAREVSIQEARGRK
jgi:hypothetical protein